MVLYQANIEILQQLTNKKATKQKISYLHFCLKWYDYNFNSVKIIIVSFQMRGQP